MLKTFDAFLLNIWELLTYIPRCVIYLWNILIKIVRGGITFMKRFGWFAKFANNSIVSFIFNPRIYSYIFNKIYLLGEIFSKKMKKSYLFRRYMFVIFLVLILFYSYPPSHWGPWYFYQTGVSSYYSKGFWFKKTASGERFIPLFYTAAHKTLPLGITVKVKNLENGKVVYVKINDRGPFVKGRVLDLSSGAARALGFINAGTTRVSIYTKKRIKK